MSDFDNMSMEDHFNPDAIMRAASRSKDPNTLAKYFLLKENVNIALKEARRNFLISRGHGEKPDYTNKKVRDDMAMFATASLEVLAGVWVQTNNLKLDNNAAEMSGEIFGQHALNIKKRFDLMHKMKGVLNGTDNPYEEAELLRRIDKELEELGLGELKMDTEVEKP